MGNSGSTSCDLPEDDQNCCEITDSKQETPLLNPPKEGCQIPQKGILSDKQPPQSSVEADIHSDHFQEHSLTYGKSCQPDLPKSMTSLIETTATDNLQQHHSCVVLDPRSPSDYIMRTPLCFKDTVISQTGEAFDPRSPTVGIVRTPIIIKEEDVSLDSQSPTDGKTKTTLYSKRKVISQSAEVLDPRSPSIGIVRSPIIAKEAVNDCNASTVCHGLPDPCSPHPELPRTPLGLSHTGNLRRQVLLLNNTLMSSPYIERNQTHKENCSRTEASLSATTHSIQVTESKDESQSQANNMLCLMDLDGSTNSCLDIPIPSSIGLNYGSECPTMIPDDFTDIGAANYETNESDKCDIQNTGNESIFDDDGLLAVDDAPVTQDPLIQTEKSSNVCRETPKSTNLWKDDCNENPAANSPRLMEDLMCSRENASKTIQLSKTESVDAKGNNNEQTCNAKCENLTKIFATTGDTDVSELSHLPVQPINLYLPGSLDSLTTNQLDLSQSSSMTINCDRDGPSMSADDFVDTSNGDTIEDDIPEVIEQNKSQIDDDNNMLLDSSPVHQTHQDDSISCSISDSSTSAKLECSTTFSPPISNSQEVPSDCDVLALDETCKVTSSEHNPETLKEPKIKSHRSVCSNNSKSEKATKQKSKSQLPCAANSAGNNRSQSYSSRTSASRKSVQTKPSMHLRDNSGKVQWKPRVHKNITSTHSPKLNRSPLAVLSHKNSPEPKLLTKKIINSSEWNQQKENAVGTSRVVRRRGNHQLINRNK